MTLKSGGAADPHVLSDPQCLSKGEGGKNGCTSMHWAERAHISSKMIVLPHLETFCMPLALHSWNRLKPWQLAGMLLPRLDLTAELMVHDTCIDIFQAKK